jgi:hypothetical protein
MNISIDIWLLISLCLASGLICLITGFCLGAGGRGRDHW